MLEQEKVWCVHCLKVVMAAFGAGIIFVLTRIGFLLIYMETNNGEKQKSVTLQDVASAAGISQATASLALNDSPLIPSFTRDAVIQIAKDLGYESEFFIQALRKRSTGEIALLSGHIDLGVGTRKIQRIRDLLMAEGFTVPIYAYSQGLGEQDNLLILVQSILSRRPRALIYNTTFLGGEVGDLLQDYIDDGGILICYDTPLTFDCDQVTFDRENSTYQAVKYLIEIGHRDLGLVSVTSGPMEDARRRGFNKALKEAGLEIREDWIFSQRSTGYVEMVSVGAAEHFLALESRPTGICVINDVAAMAFIGEMVRGGISIPEELSIISQDNIPLANLAQLRLTSVSHPVEEIAQTIVELVISRLEGENGSYRQIVLQGEVFERDSTRSLSGML
jgi:DNA-binding LacI/PurR family transcriptional regulator